MLKRIILRARSFRNVRSSTKASRIPRFEQLDTRLPMAAPQEMPSEVDANVGDSSQYYIAEGESSVSPRHNRVNPADVNRDGIVAPVDVLVVINVLQRYGSDVPIGDLAEDLTHLCDVDSDSFVTPLDVLRVINFLSYESSQKPIAGAGGLTYAIGNSLTNDFFFGYVNQGFDAMTKATSNPTRTGVHLNCSQSLTEIWSNPNGTCLETPGFGKYPDVLARPVDNVLLQPHYGPTLAQEIQSIKNFIEYTKRNPANSDTRFFIYAPWGTQTEGGSGLSFRDNWHNFQATLSGNFTPAKSTYDLLMKELNDSSFQVTLIPAGHAWVSTIDAIYAGTTIDLVVTNNGVKSPGTLTEAQLWRDPIHASSVGSFIAAATVYSAIYGTEPIGRDPLLFSFQGFEYDYLLTATSARIVEELAWQAYASDRYFQR